jgi:hypothetical protein
MSMKNVWKCKQNFSYIIQIFLIYVSRSHDNTQHNVQKYCEPTKNPWKANNNFGVVLKN